MYICTMYMHVQKYIQCVQVYVFVHASVVKLPIFFPAGSGHSRRLWALLEIVLLAKCVFAETQSYTFRKCGIVGNLRKTVNCDFLVCPSRVRVRFSDRISASEQHRGGAVASQSQQNQVWWSSVRQHVGRMIALFVCCCLCVVILFVLLVLLLFFPIVLFILLLFIAGPSFFFQLVCGTFVSWRLVHSLLP